jgi:hypothetical protein
MMLYLRAWRAEVHHPFHMSPHLTLALMKTDENDHWANRLAGLACDGLCHAELVFDAHSHAMENGALAFSVQSGEQVRLKPKTFANPAYQFFTIVVSPAEYNSAYEFATAAHQKGLAFSDKDMALSIVHPGSCAHVSSLALGRSFCSKIITEALQAARCEEFEHICPSRATPDTLRKAIENSGRRVTACIEFKRKNFP